MMPMGGGLAVIVVGAILTFALTGSVRGIDLHTVGVIVMLRWCSLPPTGAHQETLEPDVRPQ
jgi:hypothetical protein